MHHMGGICHTHTSSSSTKTSRQSAGSEGPRPLGVGGLCSFVLSLLVSLQTGLSLIPVQC